MGGLPEPDLREILRVLAAHPRIRKARLFGSRAKGTHSPGSDVDLALEGDITFDLLREVSAALNQESTLPYRFDILDFSTIESEELREHIERVGIPLLDRGSPI